MNKQVWIVTCSDGIDHSYFVDVYSTKQKAYEAVMDIVKGLGGVINESSYSDDLLTISNTTVDDRNYSHQIEGMVPL